MKILLAVPTYENVATECFEGLWAMADYTRLHCPDIELSKPLFVKGHGVQRARNDIAKAALSGGYAKLFSVDSDVVVPENAIELLTQNHGKMDIVSGVYQNRYKGRRGYSTLYVNMGDKRQGDNGNILSMEKIDELPPGRIDLTCCGGGCILIDTSVFRAIEYPYYYWQEKENWECSEDCYFCFKAAEAGAKIKGDLRVRCKHKMSELI